MAMRLLIVDDDEMNRDVLSRRLFRSGYEVVTAAGGQEALEILNSQPVDLVLLDVTMPGMSGIDVLQRIRRKVSATELPVIMVTALPESEGIVAAMRLGANDYITKPVDYPVALARIETRLSLAAVSRERQRASELYRLAASASDEGLWDWDMANRHLYCSPRWKSILGLAEDEIGCQVEEWFARIHPLDRAHWRRKLQAHIEGHTASLECEYRIRHKDGRYRWVECRGGASRDASGCATRLAGHMNDITARKTVDAPTLLPNRVWLEAELEEALNGSGAAALVLLELDGFERYRESLPPEGVRRVLQAVAARLAEALIAPAIVSPVGSPGELACCGEHQFAVLLRQADSLEEVERLAGCLQAALEPPLAWEGEASFVSASVGIAMAAAGEPGSALLRDAQAALRHAREEGNRHTTVFQQAMRQHDVEELRLEADLRRGIERREFVVHYQPKVDLEDGSIEGSEALVRWNRPGYGLVMPNDFIPLAERSGLIVPIGMFVLERACRDTAGVRRWFPHAGVSVNVSGRQFSEPRLVEQVRQALEAAALEPQALRLEVTETAVMNDAARALATMRQLRQMGVGLKLDDFGAGYSSLAYLQQFPFDTLKIDRSFVVAMDNHAEGLAIVRTIIGLARSLNLQVVAEGIERREQADLLRSMGCRYGQGFWFSRPVELERLRELLAGWKLPCSPAAPPRSPGAVREVLAYE
jgi:PAS domain S-box-containing protein